MPSTGVPGSMSFSATTGQEKIRAETFGGAMDPNGPNLSMGKLF